MNKRYSCKFSQKELGLILFALQLAIEARKVEGKRFDDVILLKSTLNDLLNERMAVEPGAV